MAKPLSGYTLFMKSLKSDPEFIASLETTNRLKKNFLQEASNKWKEMTEDEKQPFYEQSRKMKDQYD